MTAFAYDTAVTFRWHDQDGRMHVDKSNLTRVQVAPYRGNEIPGWEQRGLLPTKVYYGFRPPEELRDPETIKSVIGIPIQLNHHLDYPDAPAMDTRVGSTGDNAAFDGTFLSNSLHIQNENACQRIRDGSMRQLSLAYRYAPDFDSPGEYKGQKYDFTMRNIRGQHLALVEEGRAGDTCVVEDHALKEKHSMDMEDKLPPTGAKDAAGEAEVEKAEVDIAGAIESLVQLLRGLHKTNAVGETVAITEDEDKNAKIGEITGMFSKLGASEEQIKHLSDSLAALVEGKGEEKAAEDEGEEEKGEVKDIDDVDDEDDDDMLDDVARDALKACGYDSESTEFQRAFAEGVKYGERKEKQEPEKLDREHESEGEKRAEEEDGEGLKQRVAALEKEANIRKAAEDCAMVLGKVRPAAFDSAEDVYLAALRQKGVSVKGISKANARQLFLGVLKGEALANRRGVAADAALKNSGKLPDIAKGINCKI